MFGRTVIDSLDLNENAWYIGSTQITATGLQINQVSDKTFVKAAQFFSVLAAGTGKDTSVTITGMAIGDSIRSVFEVDFTGGTITDVTSQYLASTGEMTKVGADATGKTLMVTWIDLT
jgi:hypothetical protein